MISYRHPGTVLTDHGFLVPLDHAKPGGEQIEVFGREVVAAGKADQAGDLPWLVFLQGGPGFAAQRPVGRETWLDRALDGYRVLLLDQRGTGRSSRVTARSLAHLGSARAQADYLALFRADSIVLDAELIRRELTGGEPWSVLGQSFGGFCTVTYLSFAPAGMREAMITGGLPGLNAHADDVYRTTYRAVAAKNAAHYQRYPGDVAAARQIAEYLAEHEVRLPDGARLTVEGFQAIGRILGSSTGSHELHYRSRTRSMVMAGCLTRSCMRSTSALASPERRCTRCCTRPATPRGPRPGGRRSGCVRSSARSTRRPPCRGTLRSCSPAR